MQLICIILLWTAWWPELSNADSKALPVRVAKIVEVPVADSLQLPGLVISQRVAALSSQVDALVADVLVGEGDSVTAGQTLVKLNDELAEIDLLQQAAAVREAEIRLAESQRQSRELTDLADNKFIAKTSLESARARVKADQAILKRLQASYAYAEKLWQQHKIKAPFPGAITRKDVESGQWVKVGNSILQLVDDIHLRVRVDIPQRYFNRVRAGNPVRIEADSQAGLAFSTQVSSIIPVADHHSHQFPLHIDFISRQEGWAPGMTVKVDFRIEPNDDRKVLTVPRDALIRLPDQTDIVWRLHEKEGVMKVQSFEVNRLHSQGNYIHIESTQLRPDDRVVIRGNEILKPGQTVRVID